MMASDSVITQNHIQQQNIEHLNLENENTTSPFDLEALDEMYHKKHQKRITDITITSTLLSVPSTLCVLFCGVQICSINSAISSSGVLFYFSGLLTGIYLATLMILCAIFFHSCALEEKIRRNFMITNDILCSVNQWQWLCYIRIVLFSCIVVAVVLSNLCNTKQDTVSFLSLAVAMLLGVLGVVYYELSCHLVEVYDDCVSQCNTSDRCGNNHDHEALTITEGSSNSGTGR